MRSYAVHRPVDNEYLVRDRDRRRARDLVVLCLLLAPLALALGAFTWIRLEILDVGYRIQEVERQQVDLERRESRLRLEAAHLSSPSLVERRARAELGMEAPPVESLLFVRDAVDAIGGRP